MTLIHLFLAPFVAVTVWAASDNPLVLVAKADGQMYQLSTLAGAKDQPNSNHPLVWTKDSSEPVEITLQDNQLFHTDFSVGFSDGVLSFGSTLEETNVKLNNEKKVVNFDFFLCTRDPVRYVYTGNSGREDCHKADIYLLPSKKPSEWAVLPENTALAKRNDPTPHSSGGDRIIFFTFDEGELKPLKSVCTENGCQFTWDQQDSHNIVEFDKKEAEFSFTDSGKERYACFGLSPHISDTPCGPVQLRNNKILRKQYYKCASEPTKLFSLAHTEDRTNCEGKNIYALKFDHETKRPVDSVKIGNPDEYYPHVYLDGRVKVLTYSTEAGNPSFFGFHSEDYNKPFVLTSSNQAKTIGTETPGSVGFQSGRLGFGNDFTPITSKPLEIGFYLSAESVQVWKIPNTREIYSIWHDKASPDTMELENGKYECISKSIYLASKAWLDKERDRGVPIDYGMEEPQIVPTLPSPGDTDDSTKGVDPDSKMGPDSGAQPPHGNNPDPTTNGDAESGHNLNEPEIPGGSGPEKEPKNKPEDVPKKPEDVPEKPKEMPQKPKEDGSSKSEEPVVKSDKQAGVEKPIAKPDEKTETGSDTSVKKPEEPVTVPEEEVTQSEKPMDEGVKGTNAENKEKNRVDKAGKPVADSNTNDSDKKAVSPESEKVSPDSSLSGSGFNMSNSAGLGSSGANKENMGDCLHCIKKNPSTASNCTKCQTASQSTVLRTYTDYTTYCPHATTVTITVCEQECVPTTVTVSAATILTVSGVCIVSEPTSIGDNGIENIGDNRIDGNNRIENIGDKEKGRQEVKGDLVSGPEQKVKAKDSKPNQKEGKEQGGQEQGGQKQVTEQPLELNQASKPKQTPSKPGQTSSKTSEAKPQASKSNVQEAKDSNKTETVKATQTVTNATSNPSVSPLVNAATKNAIGAFIIGFAALLI